MNILWDKIKYIIVYLQQKRLNYFLTNITFSSLESSLYVLLYFLNKITDIVIINGTTNKTHELYVKIIDDRLDKDSTY